MEYHFLKYPKTVVALAEEINRVTNDYNARRIGNEELESIIKWFASNCRDKLFRGVDDYNPSVKKIIGKTRVKLIDQLLEEHQLTHFKGVI